MIKTTTKAEARVLRKFERGIEPHGGDSGFCRWQLLPVVKTTMTAIPEGIIITLDARAEHLLATSILFFLTRLLGLFVLTVSRQFRVLARVW